MSAGLLGLADRLEELSTHPDGSPLPDHAEPWGADCKTLREAAAELRQIAGSGCPEGWVCVPREATEAMIDAFMDEEVRQSRIPFNQPLASPRADKYKAMIEAAPPAPTQEDA